MTARLRDLVEALEAAYPPWLAQGWDAVGLVCGDPDEPVSRVLVAVDAVPQTVREAIDGGAQLLVAHHPLLLRAVHGVPADDPKGALVHRLVRAGTALFTAHTNADAADPGVSDALAAAVGLTVAGPLVPAPPEPLDKIVVFTPVGADAERVLDALAGVIGRIGELERVAETRLEMVLPRSSRAAVVAALLAAHPYEEPAYDVIELAPPPSTSGLGRVGTLPTPEPLAAFVHRVEQALPPTAWGVRAAGDPERVIHRVAVCGGAGDSALDDARAAGVDAYLTADLRHHPAAEHLLRNGPALVDAAHWATEHPWCGQAAAVVREALGSSVDVRVSTLRTDPWTIGSG